MMALEKANFLNWPQLVVDGIDFKVIRLPSNIFHLSLDRNIASLTNKMPSLSAKVSSYSE